MIHNYVTYIIANDLLIFTGIWYLQYYMSLQRIINRLF